MSSMVLRIEMNLAAWMGLGTELFGPDQKTWRFVCPMCGYVQTADDFHRAGVEPKEIEKVIAFSCIGRYTQVRRSAFRQSGPGPCDYAGGGLFRMNPLIVTLADGVTKAELFAFDGMKFPPQL